ncbi:MAG: hypothetical protein IRY89_14140 [Pseudolabrys sp.]|nr:hypothetical protein [Pseudolabrys sp.]
MHGIKVPMAKNDIDNLSEEARKTTQEKAEQGMSPNKCPPWLSQRHRAGRQQDHRRRTGARAAHRQAVRMGCARRHFA